MKSVLAVSLAVALTSSPAVAALSGFYNSAEQISAILSDPATADLHRQAPLRRIENIQTTQTGQEVWEVESQDCLTTLTLQPTPPQGVGRTTWAVADHSACR